MKKNNNGTIQNNDTSKNLALKDNRLDSFMAKEKKLFIIGTLRRVVLLI